MAKQLTRARPTSSVAGLLESSIGRQVMGPVLANAARFPACTPIDLHRAEMPHPGSLRPSAPALSISRQFNLTPGADKSLKRLLAACGEALGLELKQSELLRAILLALETRAGEISAQLHQIGGIRRVKNERANAHLQEEMERRIAEAILAGLHPSTIGVRRN